MAETNPAASRRTRGVRLASLTALGARVVTVGVSFLTIPMAKNHLGSEQFGIWVTITSLMTLLSFADLGIGNGVMNAVAQYHGKDDTSLVRRVVSSAALMLAMLGALLGLGLALSIYAFDLEQSFKLNDKIARQQAHDALFIFAGLFAANVVMGWIPRTQAGLQKGYLDGLTQALGGLFSLAGISVCIHRGDTLPMMIFVYMAGPILAVILFGGVFVKTHASVRPQLEAVNVRVMKQLLRRGLLFFVLQFAAAIGFASDSIVLASRISSLEAGEYSIPAKMFSAISILVGIYVTPLWPAFAEAYGRGDHDWIYRTFRQSFWRSAIFSVVGAVLIAASYEPLTNLWLGHPQAIPKYLLWSCTAWAIAVASCTPCAMLLNGLEVVRLQVGCAIAFALISILAKWWLVPFWGVTAVPLIGLATYVLTHWIPYALYIPRRLHELGRETGSFHLKGQNK